MSLTNLLFGEGRLEELENTDRSSNLARHAFNAITNHAGFGILGWFKPAIREGNEILTATKWHISSLDIVGTTLPLYICEAGQYVTYQLK
jgi:hypothetical protein